MISHDLLTVAEADQILYLERGRIVEAGTHDQLLRADNGYAHLYRLRNEPESRRVGAEPGPDRDGPPPNGFSPRRPVLIPRGESEESWRGPPPPPVR
jgi:ATP-binding cassette subfamily B protein